MVVIFMLQNVDPKVKYVTLFPTPFSFFLDFWVFTFFTTPSFTVLETLSKKVSLETFSKTCIFYAYSRLNVCSIYKQTFIPAKYVVEWM